MSTTTFLEDVEKGLSSSPKWLLPKYFYDERGSQLFEKICAQPEYYIPETETKILEENAYAIAELVEEEPVIIEYGSGASKKIQVLLGAFKKVGIYVPIDISKEFLDESVQKLQRYFPTLEIEPIAADYMRVHSLDPSLLQRGKNRLLFFPGSTIGNLDETHALRLLNLMHELVSGDGYLLIGTDLPKDAPIFEKAYNDQAEVTAAFNKNILLRINRELGGNFELDSFKHKAIYDREKSRVEMHLISQKKQTVQLNQKSYEFKEGETIHTESSHKYSLERFKTMAQSAGFARVGHWMDDKGYFAVQLFKGNFP